MEDLYLVYTGKNPDNGHPIIKAHLNPLVWWIWAGAHLILVGTIVALLPNMQAKRKKPSPRERIRSALATTRSRRWRRETD